MPAVRIRKLVTTLRIAAGRRESRHWIVVIRLLASAMPGAP
jgi:hypothetical protein